MHTLVLTRCTALRTRGTDAACGPTTRAKANFKIRTNGPAFQIVDRQTQQVVVEYGGGSAGLLPFMLALLPFMEVVVAFIEAVLAFMEATSCVYGGSCSGMRFEG
eukprot:3357136-Rhodomonas_salina.2